MRLFLGIGELIIQRAQRGGKNNSLNSLKRIISLGSLWLNFDNTRKQKRRFAMKILKSIGIGILLLFLIPVTFASAADPIFI